MQIEGGQAVTYIHKHGNAHYVGLNYIDDRGIIVYDDPLVREVVGALCYAYCLPFRVNVLLNTVAGNVY